MTLKMNARYGISMEIRVERLTEDNFNTHSLDNFIRHQVVTECWRNGSN